MKLKLTLNVKYHPDTLKGMDTNELKSKLEDIIINAFGEGTITGDTPAVIEDFSYEVTEETK